MADFEARKLDELDHRTDDASAPEVFFTSVITPKSLIGAYHALGRKPQGNVAIKIHSGESEKSNNLNPALVKDLVQEIGGTLVECATAYDGNRETPEKSLAVFKERGYADIAPIQIMDMGGAGVATNHWVEADQDDFLESMAEADEAVISHMHGNMMYLNVMNRLSVDCDCFPAPSEPDMHDIGVLSSLDPVALDQACVDLVHIAPDGASVTERIASRHGEHTLEYAEELGIGSRAYRLTVLD